VKFSSIVQTYDPPSLKMAHRQFIVELEPNSVITKVPSAAVGVVGTASEFTKNSRPFERAQATLFKGGK
jgi:hypothetical protein